MTIHEHSLKSFAKLKNKTWSRRAEIVRVLEEHCAICTDREIARILGYKDLNCVRPRITEGINYPLYIFKQCGTDRCNVTGRIVRTIRLTTDKERRMHRSIIKRLSLNCKSTRGKGPE